MPVCVSCGRVKPTVGKVPMLGTDTTGNNLVSGKGKRPFAWRLHGDMIRRGPLRDSDNCIMTWIYLVWKFQLKFPIGMLLPS